MHNESREPTLRRLLVVSPEHNLDHAKQAVEAMIEGNLIPLMYDYSVPRAEALQMLRSVWRSERQEEAGYEVVRLWLLRIGVPLEP